MRLGRAVWMVPLVLCAQAAAAEKGAAYGEAGAEVGTAEAAWKDSGRDVAVPVRVYFPKELGAVQGKLPVIVFSHGLGGSREGYAIWSKQWASHGYVVVNPTHVGSDTSVLSGGLASAAAAANLENAVRRVQDVGFVLDMMEKVNAGDAKMLGGDAGLAGLKGKLDLGHVGMAGHSFGAVTTVMAAGEASEVGGVKRTLVDKRITAAVAMSPQPALRGSQDVAFGSIAVPMFYITGTEDDSPIGEVRAADRRVPFDHTKSAGTLLVTFTGAVHMSFAPSETGEVIGERLRLRPAAEGAIQAAIKAGTTAFWDAHLKGDAAAAAWLEKEYAGTVKVGKVEIKSKP